MRTSNFDRAVILRELKERIEYQNENVFVDPDF